jgi:RHS repeat-associated protein
VQWSRANSTLETSAQANEANLYHLPNNTRVPKSEAPGWQANTSGHILKLNQNQPIGSSRLLKVMAGDLVSGTVKYYYPAAVSNGTTPSPLTALLGSLAAAITGPQAAAATPVKNASANIGTMLGNTSAFTTVAGANASQTGGPQPKAYLNILFFDERFNFVEGSSQSTRVVAAGDNAAPIALLNIKVPKNGYAFVYVSNESPTNVFFDDLQVRQDNGRILEENHYYAYGLKIAALSSKAMGAAPNNYQYQGDYSEFDDDLGWNDFMLRSYDPQIGRFLQNDPYDEFSSGYVGMGNDPINFIDEDGGTIGPATTFFNVAANGSVSMGIVAKKLSWVDKALRKAVKVATKAADIAVEFMPVVGAARDIYQGVRDGDWVQAGMGIVFFIGGCPHPPKWRLTSVPHLRLTSIHKFYRTVTGRKPKNVKPTPSCITYA